MKPCNLERNILKQKLIVGFTQFVLEEFAYEIVGGPGYSVMTGGTVIYLFRCTPVDVEVERQNTCFNELPIRYNNKTYFMGPKTHVLQQYGTEIDCNELLSSAYEHPRDLWLQVEKYDQDSMNALQQYITFPNNANAAQNNLARQIMGYETLDNEKKN